MDSADGLAEEAGDADLLDLAATPAASGESGMVLVDDDLGERRIDDALDGGPGEHGVGRAGDDALGAVPS